MKNDKFIMAIDGSWFLKSRIPIIAKNPNIDLSFQTKPDEARAAITSKLTMDLCNELSLMRHILQDVIIAVDDSRANIWRSTHEYLKPTFDIGDVKQDEDAGYKGTRYKDQTINWLEVYKVYWDWLAVLWDKFSIRNIKINGAEADDVIALLSKYHLQQDINFTWMGTDKDLIQCCGHNNNSVAVYNLIKNGNAINSWAKTRQLTYTKEIAEVFNNNVAYKETKPLSIFDSFVTGDPKTGKPMQAGINAFESFINYANTTQIEHVPSFLWYKIVFGDAGDNVPELFKYMKKRGKNAAHVNIEQIHDSLLEFGIETYNDLPAEFTRYMQYEDLYNDELIENFLAVLYKKFMPANANFDDHKDWLVSRFKENRKLVTLNEKEIPSYVIDGFNHHMSFMTQTNYANIDNLCNFSDVIKEFNLVQTVNVQANNNNVDTQFANTFVNGLFGN